MKHLGLCFLSLTFKPGVSRTHDASTLYDYIGVVQRVIKDNSLSTLTNGVDSCSSSSTGDSCTFAREFPNGEVLPFYPPMMLITVKPINWMVKNF
jgi:hypothetical protein